MEKNKVFSLLKAGGRLDIAVFMLTVLLAAVTVFNLWFFLRSQPPAESAEELMALGIVNFVVVFAALLESAALALLLALGGVGLASGIRALRAAKREDARICGNFRAFPVFTLIHLILSNLQEPESLIKIFIGQCLDCRRFSRASCSGQQYVVGFLTLYKRKRIGNQHLFLIAVPHQIFHTNCIVIFHSDKSLLPEERQPFLRRLRKGGSCV